MRSPGARAGRLGGGNRRRTAVVEVVEGGGEVVRPSRAFQARLRALLERSGPYRRRRARRVAWEGGAVDLRETSSTAIDGDALKPLALCSRCCRWRLSGCDSASARPPPRDARACAGRSRSGIAASSCAPRGARSSTSSRDGVGQTAVERPGHRHLALVARGSRRSRRAIAVAGPAAGPSRTREGAPPDRPLPARRARETERRRGGLVLCGGRPRERAESCRRSCCSLLV